MKGIVLLISIYLSLLACSVAKTTSSSTENIDFANSMRIISTADITATIDEKSYTSEELKKGISNIKYGAQVTLKSSDNEYYEWVSYNPNGTLYGETPSYDSVISFVMMKDLVIVVR